MSKGSIIVKIVLAGAAMFGAYKLYKVLDKMEKEKNEKLEEYRKEALEKVDAEIHNMEEWDKSLKDVTLNNEKLAPADRAYAYTLCKDKYDAILNARTIEDIDEARKDFEEFAEILTDTKDPDTVGTYLKILMEREAQEAKEREKKALINMELEKNRAIVDMIEKVGIKAICNLTQ